MKAVQSSSILCLFHMQIPSHLQYPEFTFKIHQCEGSIDGENIQEFLRQRSNAKIPSYLIRILLLDSLHHWILLDVFIPTARTSLAIVIFTNTEASIEARSHEVRQGSFKVCHSRNLWKDRARLRKAHGHPESFFS